MKIILFNVKFSPNLGDGILSECLESELRRGEVAVEVASLDLAGRSAFEVGSGWRSLQLRLLGWMPSPLRNHVVRTMLGRLVRRKLMPRWRELLENADAVIVGGGNLFSDVDLNFPIKISGALAEVNRRGLPVAVYGVGVTAGWSKLGKRLFASSLQNAYLIDVSARDERSCLTWDRQTEGTGIANARLSYDSGLLAVDHYAAKPKHIGPRRIGIGVTDPIALSYHGGHRQTRADFSQKLVSLVQALRDLGGFDIFLFSNGSPEDQEFLEILAKDRNLASVTIVPPFERPSDLAYFISSCDLVMAHRLHACIVAHSYAIPTIGFTWDIKVESFFKRVGRPHFLRTFEDASPRDLAKAASEALAEGIDLRARDEMLEQCRADVAMVKAMLIEAVEGAKASSIVESSVRAD